MLLIQLKRYMQGSFENTTNKNSDSFQEAMRLLDEIQDVKRRIE